MIRSSPPDLIDFVIASALSHDVIHTLIGHVRFSALHDRSVGTFAAFNVADHAPRVWGPFISAATAARGE